MTKLIEALSGKKTYIIMFFVVAGTILETIAGFDIPGFEPADNWMEYILAALGLGTIRAGIAKVE